MNIGTLSRINFTPANFAAKAAVIPSLAQNAKSYVPYMGMLGMCLSYPATKIFKHENKRYIEQVDQNLYRSSQPKLEEIKYLAQRGIKTILNLRVQDKATIDKFRAEAEKYHMNYINIPVTPYTLTKAQEDQIKSVMLNNQNYPLLVHCKQGRDRTGFAVGLYRMGKYRWTPKQAIKEMKAHNYHDHMFPMLQRKLIEQSKTMGFNSVA